MFLQGPYFPAEGAIGLPKAKSWWEHWKSCTALYEEGLGAY